MDEIAASSHPLHAEVEALQTELDNLWKRDESGNLQMRGTELREYGKELKAKLTEKRSAMHSDILLDADVVSGIMEKAEQFLIVDLHDVFVCCVDFCPQAYRLSDRLSGRGVDGD